MTDGLNKNLKDSVLYERHYEYKEERKAFRFYAVIIALICFVLGLRFYFIDNYGGVEVDGLSMYPTLMHKDMLLMRYVEDGEGLQRGDVIVVDVREYPECKNVGSGFLIKRLIAVEGDSVRCEQGQIYIKYNGETDWTALDESAMGYTPCYEYKSKYNFEEYKVGEGEIFFLGDNRDNSCDSRYKEKKYLGSHLKDSLYKATDVYGVVPAWAIEHRETLEKVFF